VVRLWEGQGTGEGKGVDKEMVDSRERPGIRRDRKKGRERE